MILAGPAIAKGEPAGKAGATTDQAVRDSARTMAREALALMHQERWGEAHSLLTRAYALVPAPTVALLDGKALERLGRLVEAAERFESAARTPLSDDSPPAFREAAAEARSELSRVEERIPTLTVVLRGSPADLEAAAVTLDNEPVERGTVGEPRPVDPGEHVVTVTLEGELVVEDHVLVKEKEAKQVVLGMGSARKSPVQAPEEPKGLSPAWGFGTLGAGVAGLAVGIGAGSVMMRAKSKLDDACSPHCPRSVADDLSRFRTSRTVSAVGYVVGAVGVGAGVTLLLVSRSRRGQGHQRDEQSFVLSTDGRSIWLRGSF